MRDLKSIIIRHPFVEGLSESQVEFLTGCAKNVRYPKGEFLFREGKESNLTYLVREGRIQLEIHSPHKGPLLIESVGPGEILGWSWLFPPYCWHLDAVATEPTRAITLDGTCLRKKCEKDPQFGYELVKRFLFQIHRRLEKTRVQLLDIY